MNVIVTYDIKRNHTEIKDELKALGYVDMVKGVNLANNTPVDQKLPNTTLIRFNAIGTKACVDQVISVVRKHNGGLDLAFAAELAEGFDWNAG